MAGTMENLWLTGLLTAMGGILVWLLMRVRMERRSLPPGPFPWPVLGNLFHFGVLPHQGLAKSAKTYGPIMFFKIGSKPAIIVSSPELAEEALKKQGTCWDSRIESSSGEILFYDHSDILFGSRWKFYRSVMTQELVTVKRLADFKQTRVQEIMGGITWSIEACKAGSKAVGVDALTKRILLNILTRMLMNEGTQSQKADMFQKNAEFAKTYEELLPLLGVFCIGDFVPWLASFDIGGYRKRMRAVAKKLNDFFHNVVEDHKRKLQSAPQGRDAGVQDIVDAMLTCKQDDMGQKLNDSEIKGIMQDFIAAGIGTSSNTIEWALSELLNKPSTFEKLRAEIDHVVGRARLVDESDLSSLPYLQAVVKETFRLHPGVPLVMRASSKDCVVAGYKIPAPTMLFVNVYAIQRDPAVWERPLEFEPGRFLKSNKDVHGRHFELLPFGSGVRMCPGKSLALLLVPHILALLVQTCDLNLPAGLKPGKLDMDERYDGTLARLNHLQVVVTPRPPPEFS